MRRYSYGINSYKGTAHVMVEVAPFWVFWIDAVVSAICGILPPIPMLPIPLKLSKQDADDWNGGERWITWRKWYGDLSAWFCASIHLPISGFCWNHSKIYFVPVEYAVMKKSLYELDKTFFDRDEEISAMMRQEDAEE